MLPPLASLEFLSLSDLEQIDEACDGFLRAWRSGDRPRIEDWIERLPDSLRRIGALELLRTELELRIADGERPESHEYVERFAAWRDEVETVIAELCTAVAEPTASPPSPSSPPPEPPPPRPVVASARRPVSLEAREPRRLDDYELLETLGAGGMGVVYKARDVALQRLVALKLLGDLLVDDPTARQRFLREAQSAAAVGHPHVVTIYSVRQSGDVPYLVMEHVAGGSLHDKLQREGRLAPDEIVRIGMQIALGLAAAHRRGLIHRDIKPANILLEGGEQVKITDFGLARAAEDVSMTQSGAVAGTPEYMSPEQADGRPPTPKSDLFSFGALLYSLAVGKSPFRSTSIPATLRAVCDLNPPSLREANPAVPEWLARLVERLLAKDPVERPPTALAVAEELREHWLQTTASLSAPGALRCTGHCGSCLWGLTDSEASPSNAATLGGRGEATSPRPVVVECDTDGAADDQSETLVAPVSGVRRPSLARAATPASSEFATSALSASAMPSSALASPGSAVTLAGANSTTGPRRPAILLWGAALGVPMLVVVALLAGAANWFRPPTHVEADPPPVAVGMPEDERDGAAGAESNSEQGRSEAATGANAESPPSKPTSGDEPDSKPEPAAKPGPNWSLNFDGQSNYVHVPDFSRDEAGPATLEAWVRAEKQPLARLVALWSGASLLQIAKSEAGYFVTEAYAPLPPPHANQPVEPEVWTHLAVVADHKEVRFYMDGACQSRAPRSPTILHEPHPFNGLWIGAHPSPKQGAFGYFFCGQIDELRVSKGARYSTEFRPARRFEPDSDTLALYHFDQNEGRELVDASGHGRHGRLYGPTVWASGVPDAPREAAAAPAPAVVPFDAEQARRLQRDWARHLDVPVDWANSLGMRFRLIPPGEFSMGAADDDPDAAPQERPRHRVTLTQPFYLGVTEVTYHQFLQFVSDDDYVTEAELDGGGAFGVGQRARSPENRWNAIPEASGEMPVRCVSWQDAQRFCEWLGRRDGFVYRLPTDAEWEYACRAGTETRYWYGDAFDTQKTKSPREGGSNLLTVGSLPANPFGLTEMHGNLNEICWDAPRTYSAEPATDPVGSLNLSEPAVVRGGAVSSNAIRLRSSNRYVADGRTLPELNFATTVKGFRVVRLAPPTR